MYSRLIDNRPVGRYTEEFAKNKTEWQFAPLYTGNFVKPFYNGFEYVESATEEEINDYKTHQKEIFVKNFIQKKKNDGLKFSENIKFEITKTLIDKPIDELNEIDEEINECVYPLLVFVESGDFWTAMNKAMRISQPLNTVSLFYFNKVKNYINEYVITNYPK